MTPPITIRQVAQEYIDGQGMLDESRLLNNETIASKFECGRQTVLKSWNRAPNYLPEEDQALIRQLLRERNRLEREYKQRTLGALQRRHGYSSDRIRIELYCMGYLKEGAA